MDNKLIDSADYLVKRIGLQCQISCDESTDVGRRVFLLGLSAQRSNAHLSDRASGSRTARSKSAGSDCGQLWHQLVADHASSLKIAGSHDGTNRGKNE